MKYRYLGKSGLAVSEFTLGTMTFGAQGWGCDTNEAHKILGAYLDTGGNMIDCADVYAKGESEKIVGAYMKNVKRDEILLATKCNFPFEATPNSLGSNRKHIITSCEASLSRLKTDYIDVYYLHRPDPTVAADEIMETLDILRQQGKILYFASSNLPAWRLVLCSMEAKHRQSSGFVCAQYMYNLVDRTCEHEIIPAMINQGIGMLCWSPLAGGLLTGKYGTSDAVPKNSRFDLRKDLDVPRFWTSHGLQVTQKLVELASTCGISPNHLALAWLLDKDYVSSVILGARSMGQIIDSMAAADIVLSDEIRVELETISMPNKTYLWNFNEETNEQYKKRARQFPGQTIV